jgi:hypothetical protein
MAKKGDPSGQSWGTFLHNHALHIAAMIEHIGVITSRPVLGGLHHQHCRF